MPSEIGFPMTLTSGAFLNQNPINKPARNNKRILKAAVIHFLHPMEKDNWNITRWHKTLSASAISKKKCKLPKIERAHKNFLTTKIWKETHLREVFYGTLIFQQSSIICISNMAAKTTFCSYPVKCLIVTLRCAANITTSSFSTFFSKFKCKICVQKEVIHNFKNHILVTWPNTNLLILRKWCGFRKPNHYYFV